MQKPKNLKFYKDLYQQIYYFVQAKNLAYVGRVGVQTKSATLT